MQKSKIYSQTRFPADVIRDATAELNRIYGGKDNPVKIISLSVEHDDSEWQYDALDEFLADYRIFKNDASLQILIGSGRLVVRATKSYSRISVEGPSRTDIESVFHIFETACERSRLPEPAPSQTALTIFIGHGRSPLWRDLKDHLQDKHGYKVEAYETGARAGHSIRDILEDMIAKSSFAVLVMTGEDEQATGAQRARQNVIHEAGLFQGRLGFARAIILLEDGVEEFSNVQGVQYIRFSRANIKETFGEVLATLRREFHR